MSSAIERDHSCLALSAFAPHHADDVCRWVHTKDELRLLAPSADWPLTSDKVIGWKQNGGRVFVLVDPRQESSSKEHLHDCGPVSLITRSTAFAYGELNPMRNEKRHFWLGHLIVDSDLRGHGLGHFFVIQLIALGIEQLGAQKFSLIVIPENEPAVRCYHRAGFREAGDEYHFFALTGIRERLLRMERSI